MDIYKQFYLSKNSDVIYYKNQCGESVYLHRKCL